MLFLGTPSFVLKVFGRNVEHPLADKIINIQIAIIRGNSFSASADRSGAVTLNMLKILTDDQLFKVP